MYDFENQLKRYKKKCAFNKKLHKDRKELRELVKINSPEINKVNAFRVANDNLKTSSRIICLN